MFFKDLYLKMINGNWIREAINVVLFIYFIMIWLVLEIEYMPDKLQLSIFLFTFFAVHANLLGGWTKAKSTKTKKGILLDNLIHLALSIQFMFMLYDFGMHKKILNGIMVAMMISIFVIQYQQSYDSGIKDIQYEDQ